MFHFVKPETSFDWPAQRRTSTDACARGRLRGRRRSARACGGGHRWAPTDAHAEENGNTKVSCWQTGTRTGEGGQRRATASTREAREIVRLKLIVRSKPISLRCASRLITRVQTEQIQTDIAQPVSYPVFFFS